MGLWLPFAALAAFLGLWILSPPGIGERDWPVFWVALLVVILVPIGVTLIRSERARPLGRLALVVIGWGVAAWSLLGGYGNPSWEGGISPPAFAVMLAGVVLGLLLGLAAVLYRLQTDATRP